jgi:phosphocarrier protein
VSADLVVEKEFTVRSALGLHARPAGRLASLAGRFESEVTLGRGEEWVSGSSVLSILCLAATQGTALRVRAVGADAEQAVMELGALIESDEEEPAPPED